MAEPEIQLLQNLPPGNSEKVVTTSQVQFLEVT